MLKSDRDPVWLAPDEAADIRFETDETALGPVRDRLLAAIGAQEIDIVVQPERDRRKALLIADMDSTMIGQECIDELAGEIGVKDRVAAITERAMRGEMAFEPALRERVSLLAGLDKGVVDRVIDTRIDLTQGARTLVGTMRSAGAYCALVSGGFTAFTSVIAERIGFHENRANILEESNGRFTGTVREPILGRSAKRDRLLALCSERGIALEQTLAVGDGANDLDMVETAGLGIAYHAKPALVAGADAAIRHGDLTALLYAQGYRRDEFIAPA
ncbi:MAG: phosphoserine phosphatase SerB [Pseudomonadota bacterium]